MNSKFKGLRFFYLTFLLVLIFSGCQKDTVTPPIIITEDDVADAIGSSFATSSRGLVWQLGVGTEIADSDKVPSIMKNSMIIPIETTITRQGTLGGYTYQYTVRYRYEFSILKDSMDFMYWIKSNYTTPRISSSDTGWANFKLTKFVLRDSCTINGTFNKEGIHTSKVRGMKQFTNRLTATLIDVIVDKRTKRVVHGTINIIAEGESSDGTAYSYTGVLSIFSDSIATLILNDQTYEIDLITGNTTWIEDDDGG